MTENREKLLWVIFSTIIFIMAVVGVGLIWLPGAPEEGVQGQIVVDFPEKTGSGEVVSGDPVSESSEPTLDLSVIPGVGSEDAEPGAEVIEFTQVLGAPSEDLKPEPRVTVAAEAPAAEVRTVKVDHPAPAPKKPAAAPRRPSAPAVSTPVRPAVEYWIQAGSYTKPAGARAGKDLLVKKGLPGGIYTKEIDSKTYYRLRVGPYTDRGEAEKFLLWVREIDEFKGSYVSEVYTK